MPTHTSCERRVRHTLSALAPPVSCGCVWPLAHRTTPDAVPTNRVVRAVRRHASILTHDRSAPQLRRSDPRHPFGWSAGTRCTHSYHVRTRPPCGPRVGRPACNTAVRAILHSKDQGRSSPAPCAHAIVAGVERVPLQLVCLDGSSTSPRRRDQCRRAVWPGNSPRLHVAGQCNGHCGPMPTTMPHNTLTLKAQSCFRFEN